MNMITSGLPDLLAVAEHKRRWLLDTAVPLWSRTGRTNSGLFAERISFEGVPDAAYFRTFVQARHIFSFATAGRLGWQGPWADLIGTTIDVLTARGRREDGFYVHSLAEDGSMLDTRADLYDQAFILFALGLAGGVLKRADLFDLAETLLDTLEKYWAHPNGGFTEGEIVDPAFRRQNPHMHLLEAFLTLAEESGRQRFMEAALDIAKLAQDRFIDRETGALREYFTHDWAALGTGPQREGDIIEPGHCCEWAWLFEKLAANGWTDGLELSNRLAGFARSHGIDTARGVMIDEVWINGAVKSARARCWPQTERAKVAALRWKRLRSTKEAQEVVAAMQGLDFYLDVEIPGLWRDKFNADASWVEELAPGSSLYHISCAIAEINKITDTASGKFPLVKA